MGHVAFGAAAASTAIGWGWPPTKQVALAPPELRLALLSEGLEPFETIFGLEGELIGAMLEHQRLAQLEVNALVDGVLCGVHGDRRVLDDRVGEGVCDVDASDALGQAEAKRLFGSDASS